MQLKYAIHYSVSFFQRREIFTNLTLGNWSWLADFPSLLSALSVCSVPFPRTRCRELVSSPKAPTRSEKRRGKDVVLWLQPGREVSGVCYFLLSDSIYMGSSGPGCLLCCPDRLWGAALRRVEHMALAPSPWRPVVDSIRRSSAQKVSEFAPRAVPWDLLGSPFPAGLPL